MQFDAVVLVFVVIILIIEVSAIKAFRTMTKSIALVRMSNKRTNKSLIKIQQDQDKMVDKLNELIEALNSPPPAQEMPTAEELKEAEFIYGLQQDDRDLMAFINKEAIEFDKPVSDEYAKSWNHLDSIGNRSRDARESDRQHARNVGIDLRELEPTGPLHLGAVRGIQEPPEVDSR